MLIELLRIVCINLCSFLVFSLFCLLVKAVSRVRFGNSTKWQTLLEVHGAGPLLFTCTSVVSFWALLARFCCSNPRFPLASFLSVAMLGISQIGHPGGLNCCHFFLQPCLHISNGTQSDFNSGPHSAEIINVT